MLKPETIIHNRYKIISRIGRGGQGAVYKAFDKRLKCLVALKEALVEEPLAREAFEREALRLARLRHPVLPKVMDLFSEEDKEYLIMEYIDGDDLRQQLYENKAPFPLKQVLIWGEQLLSVLTYLHQQKPPLIHRDIKPANLKVTAEGQIVLLDFGLAKGGLGALTDLSTEHSIPGFTQSYAPPEQILGHTTDERSDLYALATTLCHLLTGKKPTNAQLRLEAVRQGIPDRVSTMLKRHQIPPCTIEMLVRAIAIEPDDRPQSAEQMRLLLQEAMAEVTDSPTAPLAMPLNEELPPAPLIESLTSPQSLMSPPNLTTQDEGTSTSMKELSESGTSPAQSSDESPPSSTSFADDDFSQSFTFSTNFAHLSSAAVWDSYGEESIFTNSQTFAQHSPASNRSYLKGLLIAAIFIILAGTAFTAYYLASQNASLAASDGVNAESTLLEPAAVVHTPTITPTDSQANDNEEDFSSSIIATSGPKRVLVHLTETSIITPTRTASLTSIPATATVTLTPTEEAIIDPTHSSSPTAAPTNSPAPQPSATQPAPLPSATQPAPLPSATQPAPLPTAALPAALPTATQPAPLPTATQPPLPSPTQMLTSITYTPPILLTPEDNATVNSPIRLEWSYDGSLQANEWFEVRIWKNGQPIGRIDPIKQLFYDFQTEQAGNYLWSLAVIRTENGAFPTLLSQASTSRRFKIANEGNNNDNSQSASATEPPAPAQPAATQTPAPTQTHQSVQPAPAGQSPTPTDEAPPTLTPPPTLTLAPAPPTPAAQLPTPTLQPPPTLTPPPTQMPPPTLTRQPPPPTLTPNNTQNGDNNDTASSPSPTAVSGGNDSGKNPPPPPGNNGNDENPHPPPPANNNRGNPPSP